MRHTERGWITDDDAMLFGPGCKLDLAHDRTVRPGDVVRVTLTSGESLMRKLQRDARGGWLLGPDLVLLYVAVLILTVPCHAQPASARVAL